MDGLAVELCRWAKEGAQVVFERAVRGIYLEVTGEPGRGDPVRLLERLVGEDRLTPEAALYLLSLARALQSAGLLRPMHLVAAAEWKARLERLGDALAAGTRPWHRR